MTLHVFLGPSLSVEDARRELDAVFLPPAAQGDLYRAARERPVAIGLVDGGFDQVPAVAHKEILWALSEGIHVFGAASMGALRAVELEPFGMVGVGRVFESFRDGDLTDDDEVALAHASAEHGYRALSEPMVDVRATVRAAVESGCLTEPDARALVAAAKGMFYADRRWPAILDAAARVGPSGEGLSAEGRRAMESRLAGGRVRQKREDALALLRAMRDRFSRPVAPFRADFLFERTDAWELIRRNADALGPLAAARAAPPPGQAPSPRDSDLLQALAERGCLREALEGALARALSLEMADREGRRVEGQALSDAVESFRRARGLFTPVSMARWMADNDVRDPDRFLRSEARVQWAQQMAADQALRHLADHLRSTGQYAALRAASAPRPDTP